MLKVATQAIMLAVLVTTGGILAIPGLQAPSPTPWYAEEDPTTPVGTTWRVMSTGAPAVVTDVVIGNLSQLDAATIVAEQDETAAPAGTTDKPWTHELDPGYAGLNRWRVVHMVGPISDKMVGDGATQADAEYIALNANAAR